MPAVKMVPIKDDETGETVGQKFGASDSFVKASQKNYVTMTRSDGKAVPVNKKLAQHYIDKGFEVAKSGKEKT